jgi:hypothetical protein
MKRRLTATRLQLNSIRRRVAICSALLLAPLALLRAAEPPLVLILSGQSKMAGYGKAAELFEASRTPPPNITRIHWGRTQALATGSIGPEVTLVHALAHHQRQGQGHGLSRFDSGRQLKSSRTIKCRHLIWAVQSLPNA